MKRAVLLSIVAMAMWSVQSLGAGTEDLNMDSTLADQEHLQDNTTMPADWLFFDVL